MGILAELIQEVNFAISGPPQPGDPHVEVTSGPPAAAGGHAVVIEADAEAEAG
jgi:hypothetical protein